MYVATVQKTHEKRSARRPMGGFLAGEVMPLPIDLALSADRDIFTSLCKDQRLMHPHIGILYSASARDVFRIVFQMRTSQQPGSSGHFQANPGTHDQSPGQCFHEVIPDRIEAGTYIIIGALCGKNIKVDNIIPEHIDSLLSKLEEIGTDVEVGTDYVLISKSDHYKPTNIKTLVYPGFPTDLQQPFSVLLTQCEGKSKVTETIFENRFMHIPYLKDLGADVTVKNQTATIIGPSKLKGTSVVATDLRAGASMVAAGLLAEGKTTITNAEHILRGYEQIVEKLTGVGAKISIKEI